MKSLAQHAAKNQSSIEGGDELDVVIPIIGTMGILCFVSFFSYIVGYFVASEIYSDDELFELKEILLKKKGGRKHGSIFNRR